MNYKPYFLGKCSSMSVNKGEYQTGFWTGKCVANNKLHYQVHLLDLLIHLCWTGATGWNRIGLIKLRYSLPKRFCKNVQLAKSRSLVNITPFLQPRVQIWHCSLARRCTHCLLGAKILLKLSCQPLLTCVNSPRAFAFHWSNKKKNIYDKIWSWVSWMELFLYTIVLYFSLRG